jgi:subtilisin family serine protease
VEELLARHRTDRGVGGAGETGEGDAHRPALARGHDGFDLLLAEPPAVPQAEQLLALAGAEGQLPGPDLREPASSTQFGQPEPQRPARGDGDGQRRAPNREQLVHERQRRLVVLELLRVVERDHERLDEQTLQLANERRGRAPHVHRLETRGQPVTHHVRQTGDDRPQTVHHAHEEPAGLADVAASDPQRAPVGQRLLERQRLSVTGTGNEQHRTGLERVHERTRKTRAFDQAGGDRCHVAILSGRAPGVTSTIRSRPPLTVAGMKKLAPISLTLSLALVWCSGALASTNPLSGQATLNPPPAGYVPGQLIVKFRAGTTSGERSQALRRLSAHTLRSLPLPRVRLVHIPAPADVPAAAADLGRDPAVAWAEPNSYQQAGSLPNDALFGYQWALHNTGQTVQGVAGVAGADTNAPGAWDRTTGSPAVRVAVVDSGINFREPDLAPNIATNPGETGSGREHNGIDDDGNGFVDDWRGWDFVQDDNEPSDSAGHGTFVSGIIGARGNNGIGMAGVDWNASLVPVRVLNNLDIGTCADISAGFAYAAQAGARVVNASIWSHGPCTAEEDAIAAAPGTLFVLIAGNDVSDNDATPTYPCSFPEPNIICVAATGSSDQLGDFSSYGASSVDLAAPGVSILSTYPKWQAPHTVYADGFETPLDGRWILGGTPDTWGRTTENTNSGSFSLADSPFSSYSNGSDNYAGIQLDLSGEDNCEARAQVNSTLASNDLLLGDVLPDGMTRAEATVVSGTSSGFDTRDFDLAPIDGHSDGFFAFELLTDASGVSDGVYIDDFAVICTPLVTTYTGATDEFQFGEGTSFAAPQVAGVAALLLSVDPSLSAAQVKARILGTVDPLPGLAGKVASGGRLDAAKAVDLPKPPGTTPAAGAAPGAGAAPAGGPAFTADLGPVRRALRRQGIRGLLRKGALTASLQAPAAGRFTLSLRAGSVTIAKGSRVATLAGRLTLKARLTGSGRRTLRKAKKLRVTVTLRFAPSAGTVRTSTARLMLR